MGFCPNWKWLTAEHFKVSIPWLMTVINSDAFQDYYHRRTKDLKLRKPLDPDHAARLKLKKFPRK
jgi:hypothetical protein